MFPTGFAVTDVCLLFEDINTPKTVCGYHCSGVIKEKKRRKKVRKTKTTHVHTSNRLILWITFVSVQLRTLDDFKRVQLGNATTGPTRGKGFPKHPPPSGTIIIVVFVIIIIIISLSRGHSVHEYGRASGTGYPRFQPFGE